MSKFPRLFLNLLLLTLAMEPLAFATCSGYPEVYQNTSSNPIIHVYYDPAYPSNWVSKEDSLFLVKYLSTILRGVGVSVVVVDADKLAKLLTENSVKILVMSQDIAPYSVWTGRNDSLLVKWVRGGGILVWTGDVELWYIGYQNGSKRGIGDMTHLLYDSNIIGFVNAQDCKVKLEKTSTISDIILPMHSARPVIRGDNVLEIFGSCSVGGVEYYDPAIVRAGRGLVLRVFMTGGETDIVVRAAAIAKILAEKFLGTSIDFQKLRKASLPRIVIGEYHNWYSTGPIWFHWSWNGPGPKRNPEKIIDGRRELASVDYPLIGPYDSRDDRVIEYHIRISKTAGIDAFAIDWYGPNSFEDSSIEKYLDIAAKLNFKIAIEYEPKIRVEWGSGSREYRIGMVISDLKYVLLRYANHPAYLKVDGKPVIFYFGSMQLKLSEWVYVFERLREEGFDAIHIAEGIDPHLLTVFDCIYEWEPLWIENANITAWNRLRETSYILREYSRLYPGKCFLAGVWPGFNDEGVYGWGGGIRKYDRLDGRVYEEQWKVVLETSPDMVIITTFNDWNEGTEIEPSLEYGFKYMSLTRTYSWLYKNGGMPPAYEKPSISVIPLIEGNMLKMILDNRGDIVAVKAEVDLKDYYSGSFSSYAQPSNMSRLVAIVPYIGAENYMFTVVLNKNIINATIPVTITFYDIAGNYYELRLLIVSTAKIATMIQERVSTKLEAITQTVTSTIVSIEKITETSVLTVTATTSETVVPEFMVLTLFSLIIIVIVLSSVLGYIIRRRIKT
jgi:hypothetical protein